MLTVPAELSPRILLWFFLTAAGSVCSKGIGVTSFPASSITYNINKLIYIVV